MDVSSVLTVCFLFSVGMHLCVCFWVSVCVFGGHLYVFYVCLVVA